MSFGQSAFYQLIDVAFYEIIGVFVVGAKHEARWIISQKWNQSLKIFGCASFTNQNIIKS